MKHVVGPGGMSIVIIQNLGAAWVLRTLNGWVVEYPNSSLKKEVYSSYEEALSAAYKED